MHSSLFDENDVNNQNNFQIHLLAKNLILHPPYISSPYKESINFDKNESKEKKLEKILVNTKSILPKKKKNLLSFESIKDKGQTCRALKRVFVDILRRLKKNHNLTLERWLALLYSTTLGKKALLSVMVNILKTSSDKKLNEIRKAIPSSSFGLKYFVFSELEDLLPPNVLDDFRLRTGLNYDIPSKNKMNDIKAALKEENFEKFQMKESLTGWRVSAESVIKFIIEQMKFLGIRFDNLCFKISVDGTPLKEGLVVAALTPLNIPYYPTQNVESCIPICAFQGDESTKNLENNLLDMAKEIKKLNHSVLDGIKMHFKLICDLKCLKYLSSLCTEEFLNQFCPFCNLEKNFKELFFTNNEKLLKDFYANVSEKEAPCKWSDRSKILRTELSNIFGIDIKDISFCTLHAKQRITEYLVVLATYGEEDKEELVNQFLAQNKIHSKIADKKHCVDNIEKGELKMLKGAECDFIIKNFFRLLKFIGCKDRKMYLIWGLTFFLKNQCF